MSDIGERSTGTHELFERRDVVPLREFRLPETGPCSTAIGSTRSDTSESESVPPLSNPDGQVEPECSKSVNAGEMLESVHDEMK